MGLTATMRRFDIELSHCDRGVFESLALRVAQHPSESDRYLVARVIARALEHGEYMDFSKGLAADDEPAVWQHDATGVLRAWIEVGSPSTERLHRASKTGARVAVYGFKHDNLLKDLITAHVFKKEQLELYTLPVSFLDQLVATLDRNNTWSMTLNDGSLYVEINSKTYECTLERVRIG
ncbi:MAG: YaeQ family protein [Deltaproteobacteria bacterium]|nr:YaeQ family protein [Deltaproteobacteria bacterium]